MRRIVSLNGDMISVWNTPSSEIYTMIFRKHV